MIAENNIRQEFRLGKIDETRNLKHNCLVSKKHKNVYKVLNYNEQPLILISAITRCVSISMFASLIGIPIGITSSLVGSNGFAKTRN